MKVWIARDEDDKAETWMFSSNPTFNSKEEVFLETMEDPKFIAFELTEKEVKEAWGAQLHKGERIECNLTLTRAD